MKKLLTLICFLLLFSIPVSLVRADAKQAYKDYLYQFDEYRRMLNEFKVARGEYLKFKTLVSETTALAKTTAMLSQRDLLLRSYLLFLKEELKENTSLTPANRSLYDELMNKEVTFLDGHSKLVQEIQSLQDSEEISKQLSSHYAILQGNVVQTIVGLTLGDLAHANQLYSQSLSDAQFFIRDHRSEYAPEKQATLDRWLLQIKNKQSLYAQKIDAVTTKNNELKGASTEELSAILLQMQKSMGEAKQYLIEGTSFLGELRNALYYVE